VGAERALKTEIARLWPDFRFAYSRPGFLTFKLPNGHALPDDFDPRSVFARAWGFSLGKITAEDLIERATQCCRAAAGRPFEALHVWQRDTATPGYRGFEPHVTSHSHAAEEAIRRLWPEAAGGPAPARIAQPGQLVFDCTLVEPEQWWIGCHQATAGTSCFPGGLLEIVAPVDAVSRAYLKMEEALRWSCLPIGPRQCAVEIGCSPGGASQALMAHGLTVIGIDPAPVDPRVLAHRKFKHIQKRGAEVRRRELRGVTWLAADMNVAPQYTLDTVEALVTHPTARIRGLLLTLKLLEWSLADQIPAYLERIRGWGYAHVRAKQLAYNRQEICVTALKRKPSRPRGKT
jgi:23S rRNA (cytidine2498-2'-O)-methyltransferase